MIKQSLNKYVVIATAILTLILINYAIWQKEAHIANGEVVNIELAPVDPRSLMQGDYMTLRYGIARQIRDAYRDDTTETEGENEDESNTNKTSYINLIPETAYVIVQLDENKVAKFVGIQNQGDDPAELGPQQRKLQYRIRSNRIKFATNAFFFAEGDEPVYRDARYGQFRVNNKGEVLLTGMLDKNLKLLGE